MLTDNQTLQYLDVSGNYLGKDYFSRQVGGQNFGNSKVRFISDFLESIHR